jgi:hypothetical protein
MVQSQVEVKRWIEFEAKQLEDARLAAHAIENEATKSREIAATLQRNTLWKRARKKDAQAMLLAASKASRTGSGGGGGDAKAGVGGNLYDDSDSDM